ncbi:MAG: EamA family transporter [Bacillota bacterium]|nr:EamA family transporter [Bacillota bacterium]
MGWFAWVLVAVLFWGLGPVLAKIGLATVPPVPALTIRSVGVAITLLAVAILRGALGELRAIEPRAAMYLLADGLTGSLLAHLAYYYALRLGPASKVVPVSAAYPVLGVLLAALLLREQLTPGRIAGVAFIALGVLLVRVF